MVTDRLAVATRIRAHSPFLARQWDRFPDIADLVERGNFDGAWAAAQQVAAE